MKFYHQITFGEKEIELLTAYDQAIAAIGPMHLIDHFSEPNLAEQEAWEALVDFYHDGDVARAYLERFREQNKHEALKIEKAELLSEIDDLGDMFDDGELSASVYTEKRSTLYNKLVTVKSQLQQLETTSI